jgi:hypothetical protein
MIAREARFHARAIGARRGSAVRAAIAGPRARRALLLPAPHFDARGAR